MFSTLSSPFPAVGLVAAMAIGLAGPGHSASVDALAGAVGGQSSCTTFGTPPPIGPLFGAIFDVGNIGNGISDCGLQGSIANHLASAGPVTATNSVGATVGGGPYMGSSTANTSYGTLSVAAHGDMLGITNELGLSQSGGFAIFNDQLTFTSATNPNGSIGDVVYTFTIGGALTTPIPTPFASQNLGDLEVNQNGASGGSIFTAGTFPTSLGRILGQTPYPGFTSGRGSVQGSGQFSSVELPFTWGVPADLTVGLAVVSFADTGATLDAHLNAVLSGIAVFNNAGQLVSNFNIGAASGSLYTANGVVTSVPEPTSSALLLAGLAVTAYAARRRRSDRAT